MMMADDDKSSGLSSAVMPAVLGMVIGGGGTAGVTALNGDETHVNAVTIQQCEPFIRHERRHATMECEMRKKDF